MRIVRKAGGGRTIKGRSEGGGIIGYGITYKQSSDFRENIDDFACGLPLLFVG